MMLMRPEGIWLSTDRRITKGGQPEPDAPKQLLICCPPAPGDGPRILLGFTGLAEMPDGTPTLQWIRETIRGESRPFVPLMQHLQARLTRDVGQRSQLWKHGLALVGGVWTPTDAVGFSRSRTSNGDRGRTLSQPSS
jgi:hypothetical protein